MSERTRQQKEFKKEKQHVRIFIFVGEGGKQEQYETAILWSESMGQPERQRKNWHKKALKSDTKASLSYQMDEYSLLYT